MVLLIPFGIALEASDPGGPDRGGGVAAALMLGGIGTVLFIYRQSRAADCGSGQKQTGGKPAFACALPIAIVLGMLLLEELTVS